MNLNDWFSIIKVEEEGNKDYNDLNIQEEEINQTISTKIIEKNEIFNENIENQKQTQEFGEEEDLNQDKSEFIKLSMELSNNKKKYRRKNERIM